MRRISGHNLDRSERAQVLSIGREFLVALGTTPRRLLYGTTGGPPVAAERASCKTSPHQSYGQDAVSNIEEDNATYCRKVVGRTAAKTADCTATVRPKWCGRTARPERIGKPRTKEAARVASHHHRRHRTRRPGGLCSCGIYPGARGAKTRNS